MAENKEYITQQESAGAIQISEDVVASIATAAALETEGVSAMMGPTSGDLKPARKMSAKGVVIEPEEDGLSITLYVMIRYGFAMAEVAGKEEGCPGRPARHDGLFYSCRERDDRRHLLRLKPHQREKRK